MYFKHFVINFFNIVSILSRLKIRISKVEYFFGGILNGIDILGECFSKDLIFIFDFSDSFIVKIIMVIVSFIENERLAPYFKRLFF